MEGCVQIRAYRPKWIPVDYQKRVTRMMDDFQDWISNEAVPSDFVCSFVRSVFLTVQYATYIASVVLRVIRRFIPSTILVLNILLIHRNYVRSHLRDQYWHSNGKSGGAVKFQVQSWKSSVLELFRNPFCYSAKVDLWWYTLVRIRKATANMYCDRALHVWS